jgi:cysteine synthase
MRTLTAEDIQEVMDAVSRPAVISEKIYDEVEAFMVTHPDLPRQEAFRRYAEESGRALGATSAAYYRAARRRAKTEKTAGTATVSSGHGASAPSLDELDAIAQQLADNAQRLVALVAEQRQQLAEERERIEAAKRAIRDA